MRKVDYNILYRKARILWGRMPWRKILAFSFCLLLSSSFWFIKIYRQNFTTTFDIPIKYTHLPDSIVFDNEFPSKVTVTINDNGSSLFNYYFTKRRDTITIDVAKFLKSPNPILQGANLKQIITNRLLSSSHLSSYIPDNISFAHTKLFEKKIPVIFDGQVSLATGYILNGDIEIYPDSVRAYGSENALKDLDYAYTVNDTVEDLRTETPLIYPIKKVKNIRFVPNQISVRVPVDKYTQKIVSVPIICTNLPADINIKFFPSRINVSFVVGLSEYESITADDFLIQFDYEELKNLKNASIPIRIVASPDYVSNLSLSPSETEFIFEKK